MIHYRNNISQQGFTLLEIALVMLIISLVLAAILLPFGSAYEQSQRRTTRAQLEEINEALLGFAVSRRRLPCPANTLSSGQEAPVGGGSCTDLHGFIPAVTLGLVGSINPDGLLLDEWGNPIRYSVSSSNSNAFTTIDGMQTEGIDNLVPDIIICTRASAVTDNCTNISETRVNQVPAIVFSMGRDWATFSSNDQLENAGETLGAGSVIIPSSPQANQNSYIIAGDNVFVAADYNQVTGTEFDDIVLWLSENVLYTRMIQAGVLP